MPRKANLLEQIIVNWALPLDLPYHVLKSRLLHDEYADQTFSERAKAIWNGKVEKYEKLLRIKEKHRGTIPAKIIDVCVKSPCGYTRLILTELARNDAYYSSRE